jgi:hypothetical protein
MLLALDDCLYALQPTIPNLTRSSLHRCLQRHGISRLPEVEGDKPAKKKFKSYPIGYFHIDIAEVQTAEGKLYLFVAIDRTSKFAYVELHKRATKMIAAEFLRHLIAAVPYKIHTILTDNGIQFKNREQDRTAMEHIFGRTCRENDIEHRTTKVKHPWTTDVIDKGFLDGSAIFFCCAWVTAWRRAGSEVRALPRSLSSHLICGIRARLLRTSWVPAGDEAGIGALGLLNPAGKEAECRQLFERELFLAAATRNMHSGIADRGVETLGKCSRSTVQALGLAAVILRKS